MRSEVHVSESARIPGHLLDPLPRPKKRLEATLRTSTHTPGKVELRRRQTAPGNNERFKGRRSGVQLVDARLQVCCGEKMEGGMRKHGARKGG